MEGQDDALGESRREGGGEGGQAVASVVIAGLAERVGPQGGGEEREGMQGDLEEGRGEGGGKGGRNEAMWEGKGAREHCGLKGKIGAKAMQIWEKWEERHLPRSESSGRLSGGRRATNASLSLSVGSQPGSRQASSMPARVHPV